MSLYARQGSCDPFGHFLEFPKEDSCCGKPEACTGSCHERGYRGVRSTAEAAAAKLETHTSDGSTASYYELPEGATELQDLIAYRNMNAQLGEIFRAAYRYGIASHSDRLRDIKKIKFYAEAEIARIEKYGDKA